ncbi:CDP-glycerol glycerophosphotransferase family protein [Alishewanella longhuensis]
MKNININLESTKNYADVQQQIVNEICRFLPASTTQALDTEQEHAINLSLFIRQKAQVFVGHNLADKNYLWSKTATADRFINQFEYVFVPGSWIKKRLLRSKSVTLKPSQIIVAGSPRIDMLKRLQQASSKSASEKLQVLWAPGHDAWKDIDDSVMGSYPSFKGYLDKLAQKFTLTTVLHPRNRKDKSAITDELINADVVISDYSSVIYEAWALGKPVIFPRWLLGDKVLKRAPASAEAYIFSERIGYHPESFEELLDILQNDPEICTRTQQFIDEYIYQDEHLAAAQIIAQHLLDMADAESKVERTNIEIAARNFVLQKDWLQAEQAYHRLVDLSLGKVEYYQKLALCLNKQNKTWQEIEALSAALAIENLDANLNIQLGQAYEKMQRYSEAAPYFAKAIELDPNHQDVSLWYFQQAAVLQQYDAVSNQTAINHLLAQAIAADNTLHSKELGIGVFYQVFERWAEAYTAFDADALTNHGNADLHAKAAYSAMRIYAWDNAVPHWQQALAIKPAQAQWYYQLAISLEQLGEFNTALVNFEIATQLKPAERYWSYRFAAALVNSQRWQDAYNVFSKMAPEQIWSDELAQPMPVAQHLLEHLTSLPLQATAEQNIALLQQKLHINSTDASLWYGLAQAYMLLGHWNKASAAMESALARSIDHNALYFEVAAFCYAKQQLFQQACQYYLQVYNVVPPFGEEPQQTQLSETVSVLARYAHYRDTLPIKQQCIVYESFNGNGMSCNPYGLFVSMLADKAYANYLHVWVINDFSRIPEEYRAHTNIIFVPKASDLYLRYIACAKYLINNSGLPPYFSTRPEQKYLATWHGTPLKTLGKEQKYKFFDHKRTQRNFLQATHLITPNPHTTNITLNSYDLIPLFNGKLAETGYPRIDRTLNLTQQQKQQLKTKLGLDHTSPIVLYAPTWRGTLTDVRFDTERLSSDMARLSGLSCQLLFRGHSLMEALLTETHFTGKVVPEWLDSNELLALVDVLITDYSSIFFDYLPLQKPIIYYAYDLEEYEQERGLYFAMHEMPGSICRDIEQVALALESALKLGLGNDTAKYAVAKQRFCPHEDGQAAEKVIDFFMRDNNTWVKHDGQQQTKKIALIYPGSFAPNGITSSFQNLLAATENAGLDIVIPFLPHTIESVPANLEKFAEFPISRCYVPRYGSVVMTLQEREIRLRAEKNHYHQLTDQEWQILSNMYARDFTRMFGSKSIDVAIHFSGYDLLWANSFAFGQQIKQRVIYLHNDLHAEWQARFPYLESIFNLYRHYDKLVSVSEQTSKLNQQNLATQFNLPAEKFCYSNNLQNPKKVLALANEAFTTVEDEQLFNAEHVVFITMGRLSVEKDHKKLIDAFAQVNSHYKQTRLVILGAGPLQSELKQKIKAMQLEHSVFLAGQRQNPFPLLKAADCFVLSSNHEGQPMVLFEAMILQKPIISTDITGSRSALEGRTGHLVENTADGLAEAMKDIVTGKLTMPVYDIELYQKQALEMFYSVING